jgi:hypothetical protein
MTPNLVDVAAAIEAERLRRARMPRAGRRLRADRTTRVRARAASNNL